MLKMANTLEKVCLLASVFAILSNISPSIGNTSQKQEDPDENLKAFLETEMFYFAMWFGGQAPPNPEYYPFSFEGHRYNITGAFWNQTIGVGTINWSSTKVSNVSISAGSFSLDQDYIMGTMFGECQVEAEYFDDIGRRKSLSSRGPLQARLSSQFSLNVVGFQVNAEGYIDLTPASITTTHYIKAMFTSVPRQDNDAFDMIGEAMNCIMEAEGGKSISFPVVEYAQIFLKQKFDETPVSEMKNVKIIPDPAIPSAKNRKQQDKIIENIPKNLQDPDTLLQRKLDSAMSGFWDWILRNNLDPTPVNTEQFKFNIDGREMSITGKFWNQFVRGHGFAKAKREVRNVSVADSFFIVELKNERFILEGEYSFGGTFHNSTLVQSSGQFSALALGYSKSEVWMEGFHITADGHVDLSTANITAWHLMNLKEYYFENLSDDVGDVEIRQEVEQIITCAHKNQVDFVSAFPLKQMLFQYLKEYFEDNPIDLF